MSKNDNRGYIRDGAKPKVKPTAAKEFLSRAMLLNRRIDSRLEQIQFLRNLAERASASLSDMPRPATRDVYSRESVVAKLIDLDNEVTADIDRLIDIKSEIGDVILAVGNPRHQTVLDLRYLGYKTWEEIADDLDCTVRNVHRLHGNALEEVEHILWQRQNSVVSQNVRKCP